MACDPQSLLTAGCGLNAIDHGLRPFVNIVLLCNIMNGTTLACDANTLMDQAKCLKSLSHDERDLVELVLLCNIMNGTVVS